MHGERAKAAILRTGLDLWRAGGEAKVSARAIGKALGMTHAGVLYHFDGAAALRRAVADEAVRIGDTPIVRQLIVTSHPAADSLGQADRTNYLAGC